MLDKEQNIERLKNCVKVGLTICPETFNPIVQITASIPYEVVQNLKFFHVDPRQMLLDTISDRCKDLYV